jgi:hypothetical protein
MPMTDSAAQMVTTVKLAANMVPRVSKDFGLLANIDKILAAPALVACSGRCEIFSFICSWGDH